MSYTIGMDYTNIDGIPDKSTSIDYTKYKQVTLIKDTVGSRAVYVCWLPNEFAVIGKSIELKVGLSDAWNKGWVVGEVHEHVSTEVISHNQFNGTYQM